jgi:hypothetical protein
MAEAPGFEVLDISLVRGADNGRERREVLWLSADSSQGSVWAVPVPVPDLMAALKPATPGAGPPDAASKRPLDWLDHSIRESRPERENGLQLGRELSRTAFGTAVVRELFNRARGVAASARPTTSPNGLGSS